MSKKIIHIKIPANENGTPTMRVDMVNLMMKHLKNSLPRYYKVIATPLDLTIEGNCLIITEKSLDRLKGNKELWLDILNKNCEVKIIK